MSQEQSSASQQASGSSSGGRDSSRNRAEEWSDVKDPNERRKIQNKLAQRRFRDKVKEQKEEAEREEENQRQAGSAYASPESDNLDNSNTLSGLPWGGISMKHIVETGKSKEQNSQQSSRENSVQGSASRPAEGSGSGRVGLHLADQFARPGPAWKCIARYSPYYFPHLHNHQQYHQQHSSLRSRYP